jgi:hypothetical protein
LPVYYQNNGLLFLLIQAYARITFVAVVFPGSSPGCPSPGSGILAEYVRIRGIVFY